MNYLFIQVNYKTIGLYKKAQGVHLAKESDVSLTAVTNQKETHGSTPWEQVEDVTKKKILLQKKIQNSTGKNIGIKFD